MSRSAAEAAAASSTRSASTGAQPTGDNEVEFHGVRVVVDAASAPYLKGAKVDFVESLQESGFKIDNPNASGSCGCGHSFQVAEGDERARLGCSH